MKRWTKKVVADELRTEQEASQTSALLFVYIDDGLSRIDLSKSKAVGPFNCYKEVVICNVFQKLVFSDAIISLICFNKFD